MYRNRVKRLLDVAASLSALVILSPVFLITALLIAVMMGRPFFFRQLRAGKDETAFTILKFRTLLSQTQKSGGPVREEDRRTGLGRFLRSTGVDELPELLNILKGDMSLVGPRPLFVGYKPYYTDVERKRFEVRAGLIPPEVLFGDVRPTWTGQLIYEAYYAERVSFLLDVKIILAAVRGVLGRNRSDYGGYVRRELSEERQGGAVPKDDAGKD